MKDSLAMVRTAEKYRQARGHVPGADRVGGVLRSGPYRFYFYSHEPNEPPHIHLDRDDLSAKFWHDPVQLAANFGFRARELREIQSIVVEHQARFLEAWNKFFRSGGR